MFIKWFVLAILTVILMLVHVIFSPVIYLFLNKEGYLPSWLSWFQTEDAPAIGDQMFADNEAKGITSHYIRGILWGIRNPAYGFMASCGIKISDITEYTESGPEVDIGDGGYSLGSVYRSCKNDCTKYFNYKAAGKWFSTDYAWMVEFGWSLNHIDKASSGTIRRMTVDIRPRILLK